VLGVNSFMVPSVFFSLVLSVKVVVEVGRVGLEVVVKILEKIIPLAISLCGCSNTRLQTPLFLNFRIPQLNTNHQALLLDFFKPSFYHHHGPS